MARYSSGDNITSISVRKSKVDFYKTSNTATWVVPAGVSCATFELWGAGGGGGARCCCDCYHQGFGGGPGSHAAVTIPVSPGDSYTLNIGLGGSNDTGETTPTHMTCLGGSGGGTYIAGPGITTLCAGGGVSGNNDCYQYCICSYCCGSGLNGSCISTSFTATQVSCGTGLFISSCNDNALGYKKDNAHIGQYSNSAGAYYPSWVGGTAWQHGRLTPVNYCSTYYQSCAQMNCSWWGQPGNGAHSNTCCQCNNAGSGRNGAIKISY